MQPIRGSGLKRFGVAPLFDPTGGMTVVEPVGHEPGFWAGAPSAVYDDEADRFYLYYRIRRPRGIVPDRGGECFIAESGDGRTFKTIWRATKAQFGTDSMERAALLKGLDGVWRLYLSYVDPRSKKWRIDSMEAAQPGDFSPDTARPLFDPDDLRLEGIKDPYVLTLGGQYCMIVSYATRAGALSGSQEKTLHATADAYNTGLIKSRTGLATSIDGRHWTWQGDILSPGDSGWDAYCTRIGSVVYTPPVFTGFYDGATDVWGNYEERTGLAVSQDLRRWERISTAGPVLVSPHGSGSLRYIDAVQLPDRIHYYYEFARADGSHELRLNVVRV
jgi:hypothetical protein